MDSSIDFSKIKVEKLSNIHDTSFFDCDDEDINNFLKNDAMKWQDMQLAVTLVFYYNQEIIGFFCSSADSIKLKASEREEENKLNEKYISDVPAIKIGRLGVSTRYQNKGIGKIMLKWAIGYIFKMAEFTGVRFVTVDSYPHKVSWYEHFGFKRNLHDIYTTKHNISMRSCLYTLSVNTNQKPSK